MELFMPGFKKISKTGN